MKQPKLKILHPAWKEGENIKDVSMVHFQDGKVIGVETYENGNRFYYGTYKGDHRLYSTHGNVEVVLIEEERV